MGHRKGRIPTGKELARGQSTGVGSNGEFGRTRRGHGKSLEAIKAQQDRLTALIEDAVAKLDQIASEREQSLQELKKEAGRHLHEAASVAAFPIKAELEEWKRGVLKAIGEEFEHRCPKTDQKSAS